MKRILKSNPVCESLIDFRFSLFTLYIAINQLARKQRIVCPQEGGRGKFQGLQIQTCRQRQRKCSETSRW